MKRIAITGAGGFLGWHTAARLRALSPSSGVLLTRPDFADAAALSARLEDVDAIIHLAGVNRAESDDAVMQGNVQIAEVLAEALALAGRPIDVINGNSIQSGNDSGYGRGKAAAADILRAAVDGQGARFVDVQLPNLFGEHGRPDYNSFVATFCDRIVRGETPSVSNDRAIELLHAQDAAQILIDAAETPDAATLQPPGEAHGVNEVLELLTHFHGLYGATGDIPDLSTKFATDLFNTYRSYLFPGPFPFHAEAHTDPRGSLYETGRVHGGCGQSYVSTTQPGMTRGEHYHLRKVERFFILKGRAQVQLRRLLHDEVITFEVSGDRPAFIDMPTMWVHNVRNVGDDELITLFWSSQLLSPGHVDQYPEMVEVA
jgi:UDP-2-acetamido-2,6-beta-L-arabino-hexul-4-ose reductase